MNVDKKASEKLGLRRKRFVPVIVVPIALEVLLLFLLVRQPLTSDKIAPTAQMIVQFDSFLTAGAAVGISIFWRDFAETIRKVALYYQKIIDELGELESLGSTLSEKKSRLENLIETERTRLPITFYGVVFFVVSALLAVTGEMFSYADILVLSLTFLVTGSGFMFLSWNEFSFFGTENRKIMMEQVSILWRIKQIKQERKEVASMFN